MKKFITKSYLDILFVATVTTLILSVVFTFLTGESPMEWMGIDPGTGTIGMGLVLLALLVVPTVLRQMRNQS